MVVVSRVSWHSASMKIVVDRELCIGAAACVVLAAKTFILDDEGKAEVILVDGKTQNQAESSGMQTIENDAREAIMEAAMACPTNAIHLFEDDGTQLI